MINESLFTKAYQKAFGKPCEPYLGVELMKLIEQYQFDAAILDLDQSPTIWVPREQPVKKAKEIALEAAIKLVGSDAGSFTIGDKTYQPGERTLTVAEALYQWLIKPDAQP